MARCEHDHLELLVRFLKTLHQVRPQVDSSANCLLSWEVDFKNDIWVLGLDVVDAMDQCLVHVEDKHFLVLRVPRFGQVDELVADVVFVDHRQVVADELQGGEGMLKVLSVQVNFA